MRSRLLSVQCGAVSAVSQDAGSLVGIVLYSSRNVDLGAIKQFCRKAGLSSQGGSARSSAVGEFSDGKIKRWDGNLDERVSA